VLATPWFAGVDAAAAAAADDDDADDDVRFANREAGTVRNCVIADDTSAVAAVTAASCSAESGAACDDMISVP